MKWMVERLLAHERLFDRLMDRIEAKVDLYTLQKYAPMLKDAYAERCVTLYVCCLNRAMQQATDRNGYRSVARTLKDLRNYPNGHSVAVELVNGWRTLYPRRTAMLDELNKAGF